MRSRSQRVNYPQAIQSLQSLQMFGARPGLATITRLAARAGNPHRALRFIHVAGTNGKGSTCAMLESIYRAAGLRVGLFTSPHLVSFRERIQINRVLIPEETVARFVTEAQPWLAEFTPENHPTFFEVVTLLALRHFAEQQCDLVIWETGLGGRLDATNLVTPLASVITNVQFDHEAWLGDTLEKIATEKAGIIKGGVPVVTAAEAPEALAVIRATASRCGAVLHVIAAEAATTTNLPGAHQRRNAALALKTVEVLQPILPVTSDAIAAGLGAVQWGGRFQVLRRGNQTFLLDGAHNPAGARALAATVRAEFPNQPLTIILGVLEDKNWAEVCAELAALATRMILVPVASPRTAQPEQLAAACRAANPCALVSTASSLPAALASTVSDPFVAITGSLYLIGEALGQLGETPPPDERGLNEWSQRTR